MRQTKTSVISRELHVLSQRKHITQVELAKETNRAKTTINGYFRGDPVPFEAMQQIAEVMDDSVFSQQLSYKTFESIPAMESEVFQMDPYSLDIIQGIEQKERDELKIKAMYALTKNKAALTKEDKDAIFDYAMNYLDEVFIEIRYIISLFDKLGMSLMSAVRRRTPHWERKKYLKETKS
ncbi:helix-turn-helix domain-containing protein [Desemzia sp. C1]|uniref:helix-turn-helix domain-containing protein n=1 Tax=Desemzia sp. C1 TaxID=2892016 RepID=UPI001E44B2F8|nr:helix-turn-helix transcriptional regulator [Desemzia sp. C1]MCI3027729.1 helix-turn-helix domain-containing protein [Desemzia sp. C1]